MSSTELTSERTTQTTTAAPTDLKLEVVVIPVSDVDRAKRFYETLGWQLDADFAAGENFRVVQMTPPGSACSIHFGRGLTKAAPGCAENLYLVVSDIEAARKDLVARGADVSEPFHVAGPGKPPVPGLDPSARSYSTYATFSDPDGNRWLLQQVTTRLPGRGFGSLDTATLTQLLREAEEGHTEFGGTAPKHHWSEWYAAFIVSRTRGKNPNDAAAAATALVSAAHHSTPA